MNAQRYGNTAILLHWLHALIILGMLGLGWWMSDLPKGELRGWAFGLHKSFGLLALFLLCVRLAWRLSHRPPPLTGVHPLEARLAGPVHRLLYLLLLGVPLLGLAAVQFTPYPLQFFGIPLPKPFAADKALNALLSTSHAFLANGLAGLVILHIAAAVRHRLRGDHVLQRMLPHR